MSVQQVETRDVSGQDEIDCKTKKECYDMREERSDIQGS